MSGDTNEILPTSELEKFITHREATQFDLNFIKTTWSQGLYHGSDWYTLIPKDRFFPNFDRVMAHILSKPNIHVRLAVVKEEPSAIVGYSVYEATPVSPQLQMSSLHWLYVKPAWRNQGVAKTLIPPGLKQVTHMTKIGKSLLRKQPDVIFNPFDL